MTTSTTYPNGQTLTSTALTVSQINNLFQTLTCGMLGINPADFSLVKIDWPTQGQPFTDLPNKDCCYLSCVLSDEPYSRVRDRTMSGTGTDMSPLTETWVYTRNWLISWCLYGPNSTDRARQIHSAVLFVDYFSDQLSLSNLYPVSDPPEPTRVPEQFNAEWWERADFHIDLYEQVTETIIDGAVTSVEVKVSADDLGQVADFTVSNS